MGHLNWKAVGSKTVAGFDVQYTGMSRCRVAVTVAANQQRAVAIPYPNTRTWWGVLHVLWAHIWGNVNYTLLNLGDRQGGSFPVPSPQSTGSPWIGQNR